MTERKPDTANRSSRRRSCPGCDADIITAVAVCPTCGLADPLNTPGDEGHYSVREDEARLYGEYAPGHVGRAFNSPASSWNWIGLPLSASLFFACWLIILVIPVAAPIRLALFIAAPLLGVSFVFVAIPKLRRHRHDMRPR